MIRANVFHFKSITISRDSTDGRWKWIRWKLLICNFKGFSLRAQELWKWKRLITEYNLQQQRPRIQCREQNASKRNERANWMWRAQQRKIKVKTIILYIYVLDGFHVEISVYIFSHCSLPFLARSWYFTRPFSSYSHVSFVGIGYSCGNSLLLYGKRPLCATDRRGIRTTITTTRNIHNNDSNAKMLSKSLTHQRIHQPLTLYRMPKEKYKWNNKRSTLHGF